MIKFSTIEKKDYTVVKFHLDTQIQPKMLATVDPPKVDRRKGVLLSGRAPIWFYAFLVHHYHVTKFVAIYDPRLGGGIITESHHPSYEVGTIIDEQPNRHKEDTN